MYYNNYLCDVHRVYSKLSVDKRYSLPYSYTKILQGTDFGRVSRRVQARIYLAESGQSAVLVAPTSIMITGTRVRTSPALALLSSPPSARAVSTTLVARMVLVILTSTTPARTPGEVFHS